MRQVFASLLGPVLAALLALGLVAALVFAFYTALAAHLRPPPVQTETVYVDRDLVVRDTVHSTRPVTRYLYSVRTDTVRVYVPVPVGYTIAGTIERNPVRVEGRTVRLTYWSPDSLRYVQELYRTDRPAFGYGLDASLVAAPGLAAMGVTGRLRYRGVSLWGGPAFDFASGEPVLMGGVRVEIAGSE